MAISNASESEIYLNIAGAVFLHAVEEMGVFGLNFKEIESLLENCSSLSVNFREQAHTCCV